MATFMTILDKAECWDRLRDLAEEHGKEKGMEDSAEALNALIKSIEDQVTSPNYQEEKAKHELSKVSEDVPSPLE